MNAITSAIAAPGSGARATVVVVGVVVRGVDIVVLVGADGEGSVFSAFPPTPCEHPPTSTDAPISTAIRISARLAGR
jgi:hypothetical protein